MKFKSVFTLKMSGVVARIGISTTFARPQKCDIFMKHSLIRSLIGLHSILGIMKYVIPGVPGLSRFFFLANNEISKKRY